MPFNVVYFDGKSSKTHKAVLSPNSLGWKISYKNEEGKTIHISWKISEIIKSDVFTKGWVSFTYGNTFPFQKIESNNENFINYLSKSEHKNLHNKLDTFLHTSTKKSLTVLMLSLIGIALGMYFYVFPTVATGFANNLSDKNVIDFGDYVFKVLSVDLEIDKEKSKKLQDFVNVLNLENTFPLKVYVAKSNKLNAFALSGGKIIVYTALLKKIENEAQLTALIAHEVSHIENRHVLKNVARSASGAIFLSVLFGDVSGVTAILADNAQLATQLSFSRKLEKEADIFGLEVMRKNKIDLHGMPQLFELLKKETLFDVPTYFNNHPMLEDRILYTKKIANKQENSVENIILKEKWKSLKASFSIRQEKINKNE